MLDKSQIQGWEGSPEEAPSPKAREGIAGAIFDSREALPTGETVRLTPEQAKARKRRGQWMALALIAFVVIVFTLTMTKMGANILVRDL
ncbi:MAG TPA: hypothetical protein VG942_07205 [Hyphomonadaceae bacterium]|nr:hypothetical protein [Hyphomonadaceae bacterium]